MNTYIKKFSEVKTHPSRALQAWQILVSSAMNRQTQTYKSLVTLVETFIAQLFAAPSQMMPLISPIILLIAILIASKLSVSNHATPAQLPIAAVVTAHNAESLGSLL